MPTREYGVRSRSTLPKRLALLTMTLTAWAGSARCQSDKTWDGIYGGINLGGARYQGCQSAIFDRIPRGATLDDNNCDNAAFIGGAQIGENFQFSRLLVGIGADIDALGVKGYRQARYSVGPSPPSGGYVYSGKLGPSGLAILGSRVGYAGDFWFPYLRVGAVLAAESRERQLTFTPNGSSTADAAFNEGRNAATAGWAAGAGSEIVLRGAWSISTEFLHVSLGKAGATASTCSGSAGAFSAFSGISLVTERQGFSANLVRFGINYRFGN